MKNNMVRSWFAVEAQVRWMTLDAFGEMTLVEYMASADRMSTTLVSVERIAAECVS